MEMKQTMYIYRFVFAIYLLVMFQFVFSADSTTIKCTMRIRYTNNGIARHECQLLFRCPTSCTCVLGNEMESICHGNSTFSQIIYNTASFENGFPDSHELVWSRAEIGKINRDAFEVFKNVTKLYLYFQGNKLSLLDPEPFEILDNICGLSFSDNNIQEIHPHTFANMSKLAFLYLDHNDINEVHELLFQGLLNLYYLDLSFNNIVIIHSLAFQGLINLQMLFMNNNQINTTISEQQFEDLNSLELLGLENNKITGIHPNGFQRLTYLSTLDLHDNNISTIHSHQFVNLAYLYELTLHNNSIVKVDAQGFHGLFNVRSITLDNNQMSAIHQDQFDELAKISLLSFSHNNIVSVYETQFQGLKNLRSLFLDYNNMNKIHQKQLKDVSNLMHFSISHNQITNLPLRLFHQDLSKLLFVYVSHNYISKVHQEQLKSLSSLAVFDISHNRIASIPLQLFYHNRANLSAIDFSHNNISEIHPKQFRNLTVLSRLELSHNNIAELHPQQFQELIYLISGINVNDLSRLSLDHNRFHEIPTHLFQGSSNLEVLNLNHNVISEIQLRMFKPLLNLKFLYLNHNRLKTFVNAPLTTLFRNLLFLSLSNNKLSGFLPGMFQSMQYVIRIDLSENRINYFDSMLLFNNSVPDRMDSIDLRGNNLYQVKGRSFLGFPQSTKIYVDNAATCCFIQTADCVATIPTSQFLTCGKLLPNQIQRVFMWILGSFAVISNAFVLIYRFQKRKEQKVQMIFISNLAISDLIMGIYMMIIVSADRYYNDYFPAEAWRVSVPCKIAGTLSVLSSEASVFFVTLISIDRLQGIRYPFFTYRIRTKFARFLVSIIWGVTAALGIIATMVTEVDPDLYDVSEVCTGLPLSRNNIYERHYQGFIIKGFTETISYKNVLDSIIGTKPGMYFGIAIFTALNLLCFITVMFCYVLIFVTVIRTAKRAGRTVDQEDELKMAIKMGAIVITDLACWAPIIILSILVQTGRHIVTPNAYTWIVTFVLPINSTVNPFLYTLASVLYDYQSKRKQSEKTT